MKTLSLLTYIGAAFLAKPDWSEVLTNTFHPSVQWDHSYLVMFVAILGTTISPYLFFWQANQEVEEEVAKGRTQLSDRKGATKAELGHARWDVVIGMLLSNLVMYFIILATAATLHRAGQTDINSAADAAEALRPLAGDAATWLMAVGLIGTGFLAVPILTGSAAYALCEIFGWPCSLDAQPSQAKEFYLTLSACTLGALLIDFVGINPMDALLWTAVINGLLAPPLLMLIVLIANNRAVMGEHTGGVLPNVLGWLTTALMSAAAVGLVLTI
ncbi:MAG: divalent metal cation transporter [Nitrospira sp.]